MGMGGPERREVGGNGNGTGKELSPVHAEPGENEGEGAVGVPALSGWGRGGVGGRGFGRGEGVIWVCVGICPWLDEGLTSN